MFEMKTLRPVLLLLLSLLVASCSAQRDTAAVASNGGEAVTLRYQWPDELRARVKTVSVKSQSLGPQSRTQDLSATYTMRTTTEERGKAVRFTDFQVDRTDISAADRELEKILAFRPGFLLDADGKLIEVLGLEVLRTLLGPLQQRLTTAQEAERQGLQSLAQTVTSEGYIKSRAGTEWGNIIGLWHGKTMRMGETDTQTSESVATGVSDAPITTETRISAARIETCPRSGANGCVRLRLTQEPDGDALRRALVPKLGQLLGVDDWGTSGPPDLQSVSATSQLIVDTEPGTLVPHRVETLRVMTLDLARPSGALQVRDSNRSTTTYTYE